MPRVTFPADLQRYTGGAAEVEVRALNYRDLLEELSRRYPELDPGSLRRLALA